EGSIPLPTQFFRKVIDVLEEFFPDTNSSQLAAFIPSHYLHDLITNPHEGLRHLFEPEVALRGDWRVPKARRRGTRRHAMMMKNLFFLKIRIVLILQCHRTFLEQM